MDAINTRLQNKNGHFTALNNAAIVSAINSLSKKECRLTALQWKSPLIYRGPGQYTGPKHRKLGPETQPDPAKIVDLVTRDPVPTDFAYPRRDGQAELACAAWLIWSPTTVPNWLSLSTHPVTLTYLWAKSQIHNTSEPTSKLP